MRVLVHTLGLTEFDNGAIWASCRTRFLSLMNFGTRFRPTPKRRSRQCSGIARTRTASPGLSTVPTPFQQAETVIPNDAQFGQPDRLSDSKFSSHDELGRLWSPRRIACLLRQCRFTHKLAACISQLQCELYWQCKLRPTGLIHQELWPHFAIRSTRIVMEHSRSLWYDMMRNFCGGPSMAIVPKSRASRARHLPV
jgi:hypothetical protein